MQLPNSSPNSPMNKSEKLITYGIMGAIGIAIFMFWGVISAFVVQTLENTLRAALYSFILFVAIMYIVPNWKFIVRKIRSWFIKMDPLSFMDRYADILDEKLHNVNKIRVSLHGEKTTLERQVKEEEETVEKNLRLGKAAIEQGNRTQAALFGSRVKGAQESIKLYKPNLERTERSLKFLDALSENWEVSITSMRELIERKRTEFRILKKNAEALNQAQDFLSGNTEEGRIYQESIKQLELQVGQKIAYIEDFEKRAKPIMEGYAIEKNANEQEGLAVLEQYINDSNLFLSGDIAEYEVVSSSVNKPAFQFNLNNKK